MESNLAKSNNRRTAKIGFILLLILLFILWVIFTNTHIQTTRLEIENSNIPKAFSGYRIGIVADLHNKDWGSKLTRALEQEELDIIVIVGDLIDSTHKDLNIAMDFIKSIKSIAPIYYVSGNHEAWSGDYESLKNSLLKEDVYVLDDSKILLSKSGQEILLLGLQDPEFFLKGVSLNQRRGVIESKLDQLVDNYKGYKVLLSHRPEFFESYVSLQIDLILSGHAHGGQVRIPFIGALIAPDQGFFPKYTAGVYSKGKSDMVVSRGLGNSIIPIRINNTPELVIVELRK